MNRLSATYLGICLAISVTACRSEPSSTSQHGGSGGASSGLGGSATANSGGSLVGGSGGSAVGTSSGGAFGTADKAIGGGASGAGGAGAGGASAAGGAGAGGASAAGGLLNSSTSELNCVFNGKIYHDRAVFWPDQYNVCTCGLMMPGQIACTDAPRGTGGASAGNTVGGQTGNAGGSTAGKSGGAPTGGSATANGGAATGGVATGGDPTVPELITSAQNAYWTKGQVTQVTSGTPDLTVDKNTTYQRWDGFGGCFNEMGWDALSVVSASDIALAMKLLFDANDGANFVYGRLPLGASDYSMSWYTLDDTAGDYTMDKFSIDRDRQKLIPFIKAALQVKADLHLWASPWVVPSWMMDSASNMKGDAQTLGAHALYMAKFVEEYAKEGLKIEAIHPQNEPGYAKVHWTQALLINFMKTYLGPTFAQRNLTTEIWCGAMSKDPDDANIARATANDADAMKYIKGFGVQWNLQAAVSTLATKGPVMQTEHRCGNYSFDSPYWDKNRYSTSKPQNDHLYGEESWQLIRDWIVAGVNSYNAWNMVLDTVGMSLGNWPQNALLVVDRAAKKLIMTPAYFVFRHFSQYIAVGATRIGTSGSSDAVAFKNPNGSIVTEIYNKGGASKKMTVGVASTMYQFDVPAHGWATLRVLP